MYPLSDIYKGEKTIKRSDPMDKTCHMAHSFSLLLKQHVYHQSGTYALSLSLGIGSMG